eukprot:Gb_23132 [translate_table: standard]
MGIPLTLVEAPLEGPAGGPILFILKSTINFIKPWCRGVLLFPAITTVIDFSIDLNRKRGMFTFSLFLNEFRIAI